MDISKAYAKTARKVKKVNKMKKMTEQFLKDAFAGESMAHMKYIIYSEIAEKKGYKNLARMFKAIAYAEQVHATNHARILGIFTDDLPANIQSCIEGEHYEVTEMYPVFKNSAQLQNENLAVQSFLYALEAENSHEKMYRDSKTVVEKEQDIEIEDIYICPVCGYTHVGIPPDECPICKAKKEIFKKF